MRVLVHEYGLPREGRQQNERFCTEEPGPDDVVVYHVRPVPMGTTAWGCLACGHYSDTGAPDGTT